MLRIEIDGQWDSEDFIGVLTGLESMYYKAVLSQPRPHDVPFMGFARSSPAISFEDELDLSNNWLLSRARIISQGETRLSVSRIQYASPGSIDFLGAGKAFEAIEGIIDRLIKLFTEHRVRQERNKQASIETGRQQIGLERDRESLRAQKIENARSLLALQRDYPDAPEEFLLALISRDQDRLIPRIAEGKIVGVSTKGREPPRSQPPRSRSAA